MKSAAVLSVLFSASLADASDLSADLRIRRSCAADAPRCRALAADHLAGAIPSPRWWHTALRKRKRKALRCFVALREGDIVGVWADLDGDDYYPPHHLSPITYYYYDDDDYYYFS